MGSLLDARLTPKLRSHALSKILIGGSTLSQNPQKIMEAFYEFYKKLYSARKETSDNLLESFLSSIKIPKIKEHHTDGLEAPISAEEVSLVIKNLKSHSTLGLDGFSVAYYKYFTTTSGREKTFFLGL